MKILQKLLRPAEEPSRDTARPDHSSDAAAESGLRLEADDYDHEMSFNWKNSNSLSSSIFDKPARCASSPQHSATSPVRILPVNAPGTRDEDENEGYDPYNTGSFDAQKK